MKPSVNAISLACLLAFGPVGEAGAQKPPEVLPDAAPVQPPQRGEQPAALIEAATRIVRRMRIDPEVSKLLSRATGVLIVPDFGHQARRVGQGARGVLVVRQGEGWSDPLFYRIGPVVLGAHAGAGISALAAILLSDQAVARFVDGDAFSLSLDGGFNMANHAAQGGPFPDDGDDAVMWSDAAGLFPGAAVRLDRIRPDEAANAAVHGRAASPDRVLHDAPRSPKARRLRAALRG